jgi:hypothetical protein
VHGGSTRVLIMTLLLVSILAAIILCCPLLRRAVFVMVQVVGALFLVAALLVGITVARAEENSQTRAGGLLMAWIGSCPDEANARVDRIKTYLFMVGAYEKENGMEALKQSYVKWLEGLKEHGARTWCGNVTAYLDKSWPAACKIGDRIGLARC